MVAATNIDWRTIKLVIFDLDGTLYDQSQVRLKMSIELMRYYVFRPWKCRDLLILYHFRKEREKKAGFFGNNLEEEQYQWCCDEVGISLNRVKEVVDKWIFNFPNQYLAKAMYPGVYEFFQKLKFNKIPIAIYSDYDVTKKMDAMGLHADLYVSSTDQYVNAMKPLPNGVNYILSKLNIEDRNSCLFIGDRIELDGKCATNAKVPVLIIDKQQARHSLYQTLSDRLIL